MQLYNLSVTRETTSEFRFICDKGPLATDTSQTQYITHKKLNEVHRMQRLQT